MTRRSIGTSFLSGSNTQLDKGSKRHTSRRVTRAEAELEADAEADLKALRVQAFEDHLAAFLGLRGAAVAIRPVDEIAFHEGVGYSAADHEERPGLRLA